MRAGVAKRPPTQRPRRENPDLPGLGGCTLVARPDQNPAVGTAREATKEPSGPALRRARQSLREARDGKVGHGSARPGAPGLGVHERRFHPQRFDAGPRALAGVHAAKWSSVADNALASRKALASPDDAITTVLLRHLRLAFARRAGVGRAEPTAGTCLSIEGIPAGRNGVCRDAGSGVQRRRHNAG